MIYFTSDLHFGDTRLNLFPRTFDNTEHMKQTFISNWNSVVKNDDDIVYVLGDVALVESELPSLLDMRGRKILIKGNYDRFSDDIYSKYFEKIVDDSETIFLKDKDNNSLIVNLVHYPSKGNRHLFNLVGHIHGGWRVQKNMLNVGVDVWEYRPISSDMIFFMHKAISDFYDEDMWVADIPANKDHSYRGKKGAAAKGSAKI